MLDVKRKRERLIGKSMGLDRASTVTSHPEREMKSHLRQTEMESL